MASRGSAAIGVAPEVLAELEKELGLNWDDVTLLPSASRSATSGLADTTVPVDEEDVLTVQFDDGFELLISAEDYQDEFLRPNGQASRGGSAPETDKDDGKPVWELPARLPDSVQGASASRGFLGDIVKTVVHKLTGGAEEKAFERAKDKVAGTGARWACQKLEDRRLSPFKTELKDLGLKFTADLPGILMQGSLDSFEFRPVKPGPLQSTAPILLFIHGTASSTAGSFSNLWNEQKKTLQRLQGRYQQIWAFEHRSLTVSPVKNAIELVDQLPEGATLHVVSHSRGGLVGELLCRGERVDQHVDGRVFDETDLALFEGRPKPAKERADLEQLSKLLGKKKLKIERFVRVACPALGTTLASGRLDRWLSFFLSAATRSVSLAGPAAGQAFAAFASVAKLIVQQRTKPDALPGLESMMPQSPLVRMLNRDDVEVTADLSVIAGHREGDDWVRKFLMWIPDLFYEGPNDLIVNTGSMYGGARRVKPAIKLQTADARRAGQFSDATYFLDRRAEVSHFSYFHNDQTASRLVERLLASDPFAAKFARITQKLNVQPARSAKPGLSGNFASTVKVPTGRKPIVVVLPGIMGSELSVGSSPVWVSLSRLLLGGLADLKINNSDHQAASNAVTASALLADPYQDICEFLAESHDVITFPYDWRLSIASAADELRTLLNGILDKASDAGQPVRFLAHSMGGLVLAALIARAPDVWNRVRQNSQSRAVMLGTPLDGSWSIVSLLLGRDDLLGKLALLDFKHSQEELRDIISQFPGVLELLPTGNGTDSGDEHSCFSASRWEGWQRDLNDKPANASAFPIPQASDLQKAARTLTTLKQIDWSTEPVVYVSGLSDETPIGVRVTPRQGSHTGEFQLLTTSQGDGRVPWDIAALNQMPRYFLDAEHGSLASHRPAFSAIRDLLQNGASSDLPQRKPVGRGGAAITTARTVPANAAIWLFPTQRSLVFSGLGSRLQTGPREQASVSSRIKVSVVHGDLAFARHPVAVGHYRGDPLCGPELRLDEAFNGALSRRQALGLYAGELRSSEICLSPDPDRRPRGVVVVGLGEAGALTGNRLEQTFIRAMQEYALVVAEQRDDRFDDNANRRRAVRVSSLLIGTGADSLSVEESLEAILRGVKQAAEQLRKLNSEAVPGSSSVEIDEIELIDMYHDRAVLAARHLSRLLDTEDHGTPGSLGSTFEFNGKLKSRGGNQRRLATREPGGWWHRLQITRDDPDGGDAVEETLRFVSLTRRARAEVRPLRTDPRLDDALVSAATRSVTMRKEFCYTLFQRMLPNALKEASDWGDNLQLILDDAAAAIPWELMLDRRSQSTEPPAVASGLIRQLRTGRFRERPVDSLARNACVIGDPVGPDQQPIEGFVALPGAVTECERVIERLQRNNYKVEAAVRSEMLDIMNTLHRCDYRILHLAGHGVHELSVTLSEGDQTQDDGEKNTREDRNRRSDPHQKNQRKRISGMVIGPGVTLSPSEAEHMLVVPDLVFINCCELGRTKGAIHWPDFAANIAGQFIRMGARCVVAAGWEVEDRAAVTFADEFYRAILSGETFGRSVIRARRLTWQSHPQVNTWGAYQCYGDPGWRLEQPRDSYGDGDDGHSHWVSPDEASLELQNLSSMAAASSVSDTPGLKSRLEQIEQRLEKQWKNDPQFLSLLGLAWSDLGEYRKALKYLEPCVKIKGRSCPEDLIRLCECRNRLAISHFNSDVTASASSNSSGTPPWAELLDQSEEALAGQLKVSMSFDLLMARRNPHVRRAMLLKNHTKRCSELESAIYFCAHAIEHARQVRLSDDETEIDDSWDWETTRWPHNTLLTLRALLSLLKGALDPAWLKQDSKEKWHWRRRRHQKLKWDPEMTLEVAADFDVSQALAWCDESELLARQIAARDPGFWLSSWRGACPLLRLLLELVNDLSPASAASGSRSPLLSDKRVTELLDAMRDGYDAAARQGATPRERDVLVQHLEFVARILHLASEKLKKMPDVATCASSAATRIEDIARSLSQSFRNLQR